MQVRLLGPVDVVVDGEPRPVRGLHRVPGRACRRPQHGDLAGQAMALKDVGFSHAMLGNHDQAISYCESALAAMRILGAPVRQAALAS